MLIKDADEERRREMQALIMTPPEARLTGDEELDEMPMPSWWQGEEAAAEDARKAQQQFASIRPADVDA